MPRSTNSICAIETVTVNVVKIAPDLFKDKVTVDPQRWRHGLRPRKQLQSEQKIKLKYLAFPFQAQIDKTTISDEQVLAQYEKDKATYQILQTARQTHPV